MNPITLERLAKIRAKCLQLLAIAENRTQGKWERSDRTVFKLTEYTGNSPTMRKALKDGINRFSCRVDRDNSESSGGAGSEEIEANTAFIASCAGPAEAGWKTTISSIDGIIAIHNYCDAFADGSPDANLRDHFANCQLPIIDIVVNNIIASWEGVELP